MDQAFPLNALQSSTIQLTDFYLEDRMQSRRIVPHRSTEKSASVAAAVARNSAMLTRFGLQRVPGN